VNEEALAHWGAVAPKTNIEFTFTCLSSSVADVKTDIFHFSTDAPPV
jgi:hypothetical protein